MNLRWCMSSGAGAAGGAITDGGGSSTSSAAVVVEGTKNITMSQVIKYGDKFLKAWQSCTYLPSVVSALPG
jgi:hypothetical protein